MLPKGVRSTPDALKNWILDANGKEREEYGYKSFKTVDHLVAGPYVHHTEHHLFKFSKRYALVSVNDLVEECVERSEIYDGFVYVGAHQFTCAVLLTEAEQNLFTDIARKFSDFAPYSEQDYVFNNTPEDGHNCDAFLKSVALNPNIQVPITGGKIDGGKWQKIIYGDFDGERQKKLVIKVTGLHKNIVAGDKGEKKK